jgi:zinc transport system permease protein
MRLCKTFKSVTVCSAIVSLTSFFIGIVLSYVFAIPTGASIVLVQIFAFMLFWLIRGINQLNAKTA